MSQQLISHSPDLRRLRDEGYHIEVLSNYLLLKQIPYVSAQKEIKYGTLVSELIAAGGVTSKPSSHVIYFAGEHPCNRDGSQLAKIKHQSEEKVLVDGLVVQHSFSSKPPGGYGDFYDKMTTYARILSGPAFSLDPEVTMTPFPVIEADEDDEVFHYIDTASSRAEITLVTNKLRGCRVAIVGLGGTGSYVLDLVAKTPVKEIHVFDRDKFSQHNAFRSPGAPSVEELRSEPRKVDYLATQYGRMHRHIVAHDYNIDESNVAELREMDFVFLCLDKGTPKKWIIEVLDERDIPFVDVGMGLYLVDGALHGILRTTASTAKRRDHVRKRIAFSDADGDDEYSRNIQVADLNALNAALAVIKWKKILGFYRDLDEEHFTAYTIDGNTLDNEDRP